MSALTAVLSRLSTGSNGIVPGCAAIGLAGGFVVAMISFSLEPRVFKSESRLTLVRPPGDAPGLSDDAWLQMQAAALCRPEHLKTAAENIKLPRERGISISKCVSLLQSTVTAEVIDSGENIPRTISDRQAPHSYTGPAGKYISVSMTGPHATECAAVVNAVVSAKDRHFRAFSQETLTKDPAYQSWLPLSREVARLEKDMDRQRAEIRRGLEGMDLRAARPTDDQLTTLTVPGILKPVQTALRENAKKRETARAALAAVPVPQPVRYLEVMEEALPSITPIALHWGSYSGKRAIIGVCGGLIAGMVWSWLSRRKGLDSSGAGPRLQSVTAAEY